MRSVGATYISHCPASPLNQQNVPRQSHLSLPRKKKPKEAVLSAWVDLTRDGTVSCKGQMPPVAPQWRCGSQTCRISARSCPWGVLWLEPHPRAWISGTRLCFQPRARQHRAVDPQAGPRVRVWAGAASTFQNTAPLPWKPAPPISNSSAANALRLLV